MKKVKEQSSGVLAEMDSPQVTYGLGGDSLDEKTLTGFETTSDDSPVARHMAEDEMNKSSRLEPDSLGILLGSHGYIEGFPGDWATVEVPDEQFEKLSGKKAMRILYLTFKQFRWETKFGKLALDFFHPSLIGKHKDEIETKKRKCKENNVLYVPVITDREGEVTNESILLQVERIKEK